MEIRIKAQDLAKYMRLKGWTQEELARRCGVARQTLYRAMLPSDHPQHCAPSARLVYGLLKAFPELQFTDLFELSDFKRADVACDERNTGPDQDGSCCSGNAAAAVETGRQAG